MGEALKTLAAVAAVVTALVTLAPTARADSCYDPNNQDFSCNGPANPPAPPAAPQDSNTSRLRELLRQRLSSGTRVNTRAIEAIEQRWSDAAARVQDATDRAQQTDDPAEKAQLKRQYDSAMRDLHQAGADLIKADPQQRATIQSLLKDYDAQGAKAAAAAGLTSTPKRPVAAPPSAPQGADNVTAIGNKLYVCDGAVAGANNVSCREMSANGQQCTAVTLADGVVGWRDSTSTSCGDDDRAQRKAFLAQNRDAAQAIAAAPQDFTVDRGETEKELKRLTGRSLAGALDSLPPECRADFETFIGSGRAKSKANADQAATSYQRLYERPECREGMERIANALGVGLPHRKIAPEQRSDWSAALAGPGVRTVDVSNIPDTGFDSGDSLDSAIGMLNALSGGLNALSNSTRSMPTYRPAPARAVAPAPPRGGTARYPTPAPAPHTPNCTMDANNWLTCK